MNIPSNLMESDMKKLSFVIWDRYIPNTTLKQVTLYGWIDRDDENKDFVILIYGQSKDLTWETTFSTSSNRYSKKIVELLDFPKLHFSCIRVENVFEIDNCIRI